MALISLADVKAYTGVMHLSVILFGIGAWIAINGVWVELPILVGRLPEGWGLPSFLVIFMQVANVGPLVVGIMQACCSRYYHRNALIYFMLTCGTAACFLLIFFWDHTAVVNGKEHSVAFFSLFLVMGFVDCTSSVTFMPYMSQFQSVFLTTYFIGEGLSGFLPSIFALIQGVSQTYCKNVTSVNTTTNETYNDLVLEYHDPRFSVEVFFVLLCLMMTLCSIAFVSLNHSKLARLFIQKEGDNIEVAKSTSTELSMRSRDDQVEHSYSAGHAADTDQNDPSTSIVEGGDKTSALVLKHYVYLYTLIFWASCLSNGVMPSVISYSSLPYGHLPYHFAATLGAMANPVACFIALFLPVRSHTLVGVFIAIMTGFAAYLMTLAVESPCPILVGTGGGSALMVLSQIFFSFTASYAKVSIGQILRNRGCQNSLLWYGAFTQLGALIGACVMFPMVNVYRLFKSGNECTTVCL